MLALEKESELARLEWQSRESQLNRRFEEQQAEKNQVFQKEMLSRRSRMDVIVFGVIVTVVLALATIGAAFIERGSILGSGPTGVEIHVVVPSVADTEGSPTESTSE